VRQIYESEHKNQMKYQQFDFHHYTGGQNYDSLKVMVQKVEADIVDHGYFIENVAKRQVEKL
jgi:hypothetical protein